MTEAMLPMSSEMQVLLMGTGGCGLLGIAVGALVKRAIRWFAVTIGFLAVLIKVLVWMDIVEVHWDRVETKVVPLLDFNEDGQVNDTDIRVLAQIGMDALTEGIPNVAGFITGMMIALRYL